MAVGALEALDDFGVIAVMHRGFLSSGEDSGHPPGWIQCNS